jgi:heptaprenylglyceryl phosphate synthase
LLQRGTQLIWIEGFTDAESAQVLTALQNNPAIPIALKRTGTASVRTQIENVFINGRGRIYQDLLSLRH